ncbi:isopentenyl-diphosphate delta-isomerase IDI1 KNAG_0H01540 [Huiozyma naganishii CBS 8797]|uniref:Isopentenyl-diphosphate Delta-isomerase n=1 Tax=Huiozyma naganishii (strain ATCC MYA-139 / BCRC 22969 / CBS 8797 / KCTC 17520 / NBRC 10181 / NCYC 3082 / Yp74L-3) TaxID=1071383 RepID=J7RPF4_HUIN7|nr:hypothetical protein KNAG_0H01540 [Kazachstania naganishii CBS 8797]CCK71568.1 hypothetical protein KNAG_0H01540 [Kazachstania naganishii CBS 8797]
MTVSTATATATEVEARGYSALVESLTPETILEEFPTDVIPLAQRPNSKASDVSTLLAQPGAATEFRGLDEEQVRLMAENCIVVDWDDTVVGAGTKRACHRMENIAKGLLHRAFSCFLFNSRGELLLQRRASEKITFPMLWTNTCCSHPLCVEDEMDGVEGAQTACVRKLEHELGIPPQEVATRGSFHFLNRIHYMAPCGGDDNPWGEHEIDYIFVYKVREGQELTVNANVNEVEEYKWIGLSEFKAMLADTENQHFTPWFKIICKHYLFKWWGALDNIEQFENDSNVYRML